MPTIKRIAKSYPINIPTTKFLEKFTSTENLISSLFVKEVKDNMPKNSQNTGNDIKSNYAITDIEYTIFCVYGRF